MCQQPRPSSAAAPAPVSALSISRTWRSGCEHPTRFGMFDRAKSKGRPSTTANRTTYRPRAPAGFFTAPRRSQTAIRFPKSSFDVRDYSTVPSPLKGTTRTVAVFPPGEEITVYRDRDSGASKDCDWQRPPAGNRGRVVGPPPPTSRRASERLISLRVLYPRPELLPQDRRHPLHHALAVLRVRGPLPLVDGCHRHIPPQVDRLLPIA